MCNCAEALKRKEKKYNWKKKKKNCSYGRTNDLWQESLGNLANKGALINGKHTSLNAQKCLHAKGQLCEGTTCIIKLPQTFVLGLRTKWLTIFMILLNRWRTWGHVSFWRVHSGWISFLMRPLQAEQRKQIGALKRWVFCTLQTRLSFAYKGSA